MPSKTKNEDPDGVKFDREEDGSITAKDRETGLARGGRTRSKALANLAGVLALEEGEGEPIEDPDAFLRNLGINPEEKVDEPLTILRTPKLI